MERCNGPDINYNFTFMNLPPLSSRCICVVYLRLIFYFPRLAVKHTYLNVFSTIKAYPIKISLFYFSILIIYGFGRE